MKVINPKSDFGFYEAGDEDFVELFTDKIDIESSNDVQLDLSECITNYPATSKIIDVILIELSKIKGDKKFCIDIGDENEEDKALVLNKLFFGSEYLGIQNDIELLNIEKMEKLLNEKINDKNITLSIKNIEKGITYYGR